MNTELLFRSLFIISITSFCIRWVTNWILLNKINHTNYYPFLNNYSFNDFIPLFKHVAISEWKIWWGGNEFRQLTYFSNIFSVILYLAVILISVSFKSCN